jgi:hypothetical protein
LRDKSEKKPYPEFKYLLERVWFKATPFLTGFTHYRLSGGEPPNYVEFRDFALYFVIQG